MSRLSTRGVIATATAGLAAVVGYGAVPAVAAPAVQSLKCDLSMNTDASYDSTTGLTTYTVNSGGGSCLGDFKGTRVVNILSGTGTSTGFGPGSGCPTSSTTDFTLTVVAQLTSTATGAVTTVTETLNSPGLSDIPGTDTVQVKNEDTGNTGPGVFSYKIAHNCSSGNDSTQFAGLFPL